MKDIFTAPFVDGMLKTIANKYRLGWDERSGGNISYLLDGKSSPMPCGKCAPSAS